MNELENPDELEAGDYLDITYRSNVSKNERTITVETTKVRSRPDATDSDVWHTVTASDPDGSRFVRFSVHESGESADAFGLVSLNSKSDDGRSLGLMQSIERDGRADVPMGEAFETVRNAEPGDIVRADGREFVRTTNDRLTFENPENAGETYSFVPTYDGLLISAIGLDADYRETVREAEAVETHERAIDTLRDAQANALRSLRRGEPVSIDGRTWEVAESYRTDSPYVRLNDPDGETETVGRWDAFVYVEWDGLRFGERIDGETETGIVSEFDGIEREREIDGDGGENESDDAGSDRSDDSQEDESADESVPTDDESESPGLVTDGGTNATDGESADEPSIPSVPSRDEFKKARLQLGLSQEDVAERIGVSKTAVSRWERGESGKLSDFKQYELVLHREYVRRFDSGAMGSGGGSDE